MNAEVGFSKILPSLATRALVAILLDLLILVYNVHTLQMKLNSISPTGAFNHLSCRLGRLILELLKGWNEDSVLGLV